MPFSSLAQVVIAALLLVALVFLSVAGILGPVLDWGRIGTEVLSYPAVQVFARLEAVFSIIGQIGELATENRLLNQQVGKLTSQLATLEKAKDENDVLRAALGFSSQDKQALLPAEIIARDPFNPDEKITLNRGSNQGVAAGSAVIVSGNILVGVISTVSDNTSQMDLLTSSSVVVNAAVVPGGPDGVVRGEHGLGLTFDLVPQTAALNSGDQIITSGLGGNFPKNLSIGSVGKVISSQSDLFQETSVLPATDLRALDFLFIIKK